MPSTAASIPAFPLPNLYTRLRAIAVLYSCILCYRVSVLDIESYTHLDRLLVILVSRTLVKKHSVAGR